MMRSSLGNNLPRTFFLLFLLLIITSSDQSKPKSSLRQSLDPFSSTSPYLPSPSPYLYPEATPTTFPMVDPDFNRDPCELIESRGFICDVHYTVTSDGYILTLYRIINPLLDQESINEITEPGFKWRRRRSGLKKRSHLKRRKLKRPVLLMHGLIGSCIDYIIGSPGGHAIPPPPVGMEIVPQSSNLGFELANSGYGLFSSALHQFLMLIMHILFDPC